MRFLPRNGNASYESCVIVYIGRLPWYRYIVYVNYRGATFGPMTTQEKNPSHNRVHTGETSITCGVIYTAPKNYTDFVFIRRSVYIFIYLFIVIIFFLWHSRASSLPPASFRTGFLLVVHLPFPLPLSIVSLRTRYTRYLCAQRTTIIVLRCPSIVCDRCSPTSSSVSVHIYIHIYTHAHIGVCVCVYINKYSGICGGPGDLDATVTSINATAAVAAVFFPYLLYFYTPLLTFFVR